MMKQGTKCGQCKALDFFYRNKNTLDGYTYECKLCNAARSINYYNTHKSQVQETNRKYALDHKPHMRDLRARRRKRNHELVAQAKSKPCMDCGQSFIPFVMDLDHVRCKKLFTLSQHGVLPVFAIKKEIAKCDTVCSNCHRLRTWQRMTRSKS
jgi:hypothetical protein